MNIADIPGLTAVLPEIVLALGSMGLLMLGVFSGDRSTGTVSWLAVVLLAVVSWLVSSVTPMERLDAFSGMFRIDVFAGFMKQLALLGSALAIVMSMSFNDREKIARFEYPVLFLFATLGMMMMVSANDLIALYVGLELQSLSLYVVAAFRRDSIKSTEAGLKYFVLGALSSGLLLYGASLIYGFSGSTGFDDLAGALGGDGNPAPIGVVVGMVFVMAALAFKVSAAPFHMWTPDVYEGAPTPVTAFFAVAPKIAAVALLVRVMTGPFGPLLGEWQQVVVVISIASMLIGAFAAIWQTNIKRLMAYSSIGHIGYALVGLAAGGEVGVRGVLVYMAIYLFMNVGTFAVILSMRRRGQMVEGISDLAGLGQSDPRLAAALAIFMFSMAGIPPLAGFFGKLYVFMAAIDAGLVALAVIGVLSSVVSAFYYIRIVKVMYFDDPGPALDRSLDPATSVILIGTGLFVLLFFAVPAPLIAGADAAAKSLFGG